jgi:hypothetical protein
MLVIEKMLRMFFDSKVMSQERMELPLNMLGVHMWGVANKYC